MKRIMLFLFATSLFAACKGKGQQATKPEMGKNINSGQLIEITKKSDFPAMVKLVEELSYIVLDSSKMEDGSLVYIAGEQKLFGNVLSCNINSKNKINQTIFSTSDKETYNYLRKQLSSLGYKSSGKEKGSGKMIETEEFEKDNFIVAIAARADDDTIEYEFTFLYML
ncbi:MAG TPA: hypothetical protein PKC72_13400 [Chitinophagaceae bacterium]|nr:hypothetical protein [Chitinophagaceae bacterium]